MAHNFKSFNKLLLLYTYRGGGFKKLALTPTIRRYGELKKKIDQKELQPLLQTKRLTVSKIKQIENSFLGKHYYNILSRRWIEVKDENIVSFILQSCEQNDAIDFGCKYYKKLVETGRTMKPAEQALFFNFMKRNQELFQKNKDFLYKQFCNLRDTTEVMDDATLRSCVSLLCCFNNHWKEAIDLIESRKEFVTNINEIRAIVAAAAFRNNEVELGWDLIQSTNEKSVVQALVAYIEHLKDAVLKNNFTIEKLDRLFQFMGDKKIFLRKLDINFYRELKNITELLNNHYEKDYTWKLSQSVVDRETGFCPSCHKSLNSIQLDAPSFSTLRSAFFNDVLVGKDINIKSSHAEAHRFYKFLCSTSHIDVIIDGLNIAYKEKNNIPKNDLGKIYNLLGAINYFRNKNKKVLLIGRIHMKFWPKFQEIERQCSVFLLDNSTDDDAYLIYAAMFKGLDTYIFTGDFLRGKTNYFTDPKLAELFEIWQKTHQYGIIDHNIITPPINHTLFTHKTQPENESNTGEMNWHIACAPNEFLITGYNFEATLSWICLQRLSVEKAKLKDMVAENSSTQNLAGEPFFINEDPSPKVVDVPEDFLNPRARNTGMQELDDTLDKGLFGPADFKWNKISKTLQEPSNFNRNKISKNLQEPSDVFTKTDFNWNEISKNLKEPSDLFTKTDFNSNEMSKNLQEPSDLFTKTDFNSNEMSKNLQEPSDLFTKTEMEASNFRKKILDDSANLFRKSNLSTEKPLFYQKTSYKQTDFKKSRVVNNIYQVDAPENNIFSEGTPWKRNMFEFDGLMSTNDSNQRNQGNIFRKAREMDEYQTTYKSSDRNSYNNKKDRGRNRTTSDFNFRENNSKTVKPDNPSIFSSNKDRLILLQEGSNDNTVRQNTDSSPFTSSFGRSLGQKDETPQKKSEERKSAVETSGEDSTQTSATKISKATESSEQQTEETVDSAKPIPFVSSFRGVHRSTWQKPSSKIQKGITETKEGGGETSSAGNAFKSGLEEERLCEATEEAEFKPEKHSENENILDKSDIKSEKSHSIIGGGNSDPKNEPNISKIAKRHMSSFKKSYIVKNSAIKPKDATIQSTTSSSTLHWTPDAWTSDAELNPEISETADDEASLNQWENFEDNFFDETLKRIHALNEEKQRENKRMFEERFLVDPSFENLKFYSDKEKLYGATIDVLRHSSAKIAERNDASKLDLEINELSEMADELIKTLIERRKNELANAVNEDTGNVENAVYEDLQNFLSKSSEKIQLKEAEDQEKIVVDSISEAENKLKEETFFDEKINTEHEDLQIFLSKSSEKILLNNSKAQEELLAKSIADEKQLQEDEKFLDNYVNTMHEDLQNFLSESSAKIRSNNSKAQEELLAKSIADEKQLQEDEKFLDNYVNTTYEDLQNFLSESSAKILLNNSKAEEELLTKSIAGEKQLQEDEKFLDNYVNTMHEDLQNFLSESSKRIQLKSCEVEDQMSISEEENNKKLNTVDTTNSLKPESRNIEITELYAIADESLHKASVRKENNPTKPEEIGIKEETTQLAKEENVQKLETNSLKPESRNIEITELYAIADESLHKASVRKENNPIKPEEFGIKEETTQLAGEENVQKLDTNSLKPESSNIEITELYAITGKLLQNSFARNKTAEEIRNKEGIFKLPKEENVQKSSTNQLEPELSNNEITDFYGIANESLQKSSGRKKNKTIKTREMKKNEGVTEMPNEENVQKIFTTAINPAIGVNVSDELLQKFSERKNRVKIFEEAEKSEDVTKMPNEENFPKLDRITPKPDSLQSEINELYSVDLGLLQTFSGKKNIKTSRPEEMGKQEQVTKSPNNNSSNLTIESSSSESKDTEEFSSNFEDKQTDDFYERVAKNVEKKYSELRQDKEFDFYSRLYPDVQKKFSELKGLAKRDSINIKAKFESSFMKSLSDLDKNPETTKDVKRTPKPDLNSFDEVMKQVKIRSEEKGEPVKPNASVELTEEEKRSDDYYKTSLKALTKVFQTTYIEKKKPKTFESSFRKSKSSVNKNFPVLQNLNLNSEPERSDLNQQQLHSAISDLLAFERENLMNKAKKVDPREEEEDVEDEIIVENLVDDEFLGRLKSVHQDPQIGNDGNLDFVTSSEKILKEESPHNEKIYDELISGLQEPKVYEEPDESALPPKNVSEALGDSVVDYEPFFNVADSLVKKSKERKSIKSGKRKNSFRNSDEYEELDKSASPPKDVSEALGDSVVDYEPFFNVADSIVKKSKERKSKKSVKRKNSFINSDEYIIDEKLIKNYFTASNNLTGLDSRETHGSKLYNSDFPAQEEKIPPAEFEDSLNLNQKNFETDIVVEDSKKYIRSNASQNVLSEEDVFTWEENLNGDRGPNESEVSFKDLFNKDLDQKIDSFCKTESKSTKNEKIRIFDVGKISSNTYSNDVSLEEVDNNRKPKMFDNESSEELQDSISDVQFTEPPEPLGRMFLSEADIKPEPCVLDKNYILNSVTNDLDSDWRQSHSDLKSQSAFKFSKTIEDELPWWKFPDHRSRNSLSYSDSDSNSRSRSQNHSYSQSYSLRKSREYLEVDIKEVLKD